MSIRIILPHSQEIECAICLDIIDNQAKHITRCNHVFHKGCLEQVVTNCCPLCRSELTPSNELAQQIQIQADIRADLFQRAVAIREQAPQIAARWRATQAQLDQEQSAEQAQLTQEYISLRLLSEEQFCVRRLSALTEEQIERAYMINQSEHSALDRRERLALTQLNDRHREVRVQMREQFLASAREHQEQSDLLADELERAINAHIAAQQRYFNAYGTLP
jgi:hypothetical protein